MTVLAEEIETPGEGQIRALITSAGNPVLSAPGGARLERALAHARLHGLDRSVPQRDHAPRARDPAADVAARALALRPRAQRVRGAQRREVLAAAVRARAPTSATTGRSASGCGRAHAAAEARRRARLRAVLGKLGPEAIIDLALRTGRYGIARQGPHAREAARGAARHRSRPARAAPAGAARHRRSQASQLAPQMYLDDLPRLERARCDQPATGLVMIGRRHLRSNNSWMHNSERLVKGQPRCTLLIHPDDAAQRGLVDGDPRGSSTRPARSSCPVEVTDAMMPRRRQRAARLGPRPGRRAARRRERDPGARRSTTSPPRTSSTRCRATRRSRASRSRSRAPDDHSANACTRLKSPLKRF